MKISNYMNNTNSIMEKNTDKVQKGNRGIEQIVNHEKCLVI